MLFGSAAKSHLREAPALRCSQRAANPQQERKIMRKTLLLFTTMAVALLLAAGMAGAALPAPTVVPPTVPADGATGVNTATNITVKFSEPMSTKSLGICNHCTSTTSSQTFYLLKGEFTARSATKNPMRFCHPGVTPPATPPTTTTPACDPANLVPATVSYNAGTLTATLNPFGSSTTVLQSGAKYTVVVEGSGDGDFVAVKDADGTPLLTAGTGDYIFHFTTATGGPGPA
jgi:Bacterial Ig-like domain